MSLRSLLERLDDETLRELFSESVLQRGRAYTGRVREIRCDGQNLSGQVDGRGHAWQTSLRLERQDFDGRLTVAVSSRCSCSKGGRCEHALALLLAAREPGGLRERPRDEVVQWSQRLTTRIQAARRAPARRDHYGLLFAIYCDSGRRGCADVHIYKTRVDRDGTPLPGGERWFNLDQALLRPPAFVRDIDLPVLRLLREAERRRERESGPFGHDAPELLQALLASGRAFIAANEKAALKPLKAGAERTAQLCWEPLDDGLKAVVSVYPPATRLLRGATLHYLDAPLAQAGPVRSAVPEILEAILELPVLRPVEWPLVSAALARLAPTLPRPGQSHPAPDTRGTATLRQPLQPVLRLGSTLAWEICAHRGYPGAIGSEYDWALPLFRYGEFTLPAGEADAERVQPDGTRVRLERDLAAEQEALSALPLAGFQALEQRWLKSPTAPPDGALGLASEQAWERFFSQLAPALQAAGWQLEYPADFRHAYHEITHWQADFAAGEQGLYEMSLGIEVDGQHLDLAPLLHNLFAHDARWLDGKGLARIPDDEAILLVAGNGCRVRVGAARVKPIAALLLTLFERNAPLRFSVLDVSRVDAALAGQWQRTGYAPLTHWQSVLDAAGHISPVSAPPGFGGSLRPYQQHGLAWLQHLRAHALAGILADDMGLGKTAQVLAHILMEKHEGRLDHPVLVVAPTSLVFNWAREAGRFTPTLRVLKLHGKSRQADFAQLTDADLCLTTYPLLWRDRAMLTAHDWHMLILDEAHLIKNAASQAARTVREIRAQHRLSMTGTPLENHLGELWAQFDFLLPGLLGNARAFKRQWRQPIEQGDMARREQLAQRIAPFVLRRRKQDVASELPAKSVAIRSVTLEGPQRDLYETVRAAMDLKVRNTIAARGYARSRVSILDALLKLRQLCCDPRLLGEHARGRGAKLDLLMQMLPQLIAEGRRILVFSQFVNMLTLIEEELVDAKIAYVKLTGRTRDREAVVDSFQRGDVAVFLISLKAGGSGLNLTTADTVIHFDPWWNPAAEAQATDRAHRIGQAHQVFVYKLIVAGSIEERILALQEHKADLASAMLADDDAGGNSGTLREEQLDALFAPISAD